jgi:hypothetical protein
MLRFIAICCSLFAPSIAQVWTVKNYYTTCGGALQGFIAQTNATCTSAPCSVQARGITISISCPGATAPTVPSTMISVTRYSTGNTCIPANAMTITASNPGFCIGFTTSAAPTSQKMSCDRSSPNIMYVSTDSYLSSANCSGSPFNVLTGLGCYGGSFFTCDNPITSLTTTTTLTVATTKPGLSSLLSLSVSLMVLSLVAVF